MTPEELIEALGDVEDKFIIEAHNESEEFKDSETDYNSSSNKSQSENKEKVSDNRELIHIEKYNGGNRKRYHFIWQFGGIAAALLLAFVTIRVELYRNKANNSAVNNTLSYDSRKESEENLSTPSPGYSFSDQTVGGKQEKRNESEDLDSWLYDDGWPDDDWVWEEKHDNGGKQELIDEPELPNGTLDESEKGNTEEIDYEEWDDEGEPNAEDPDEFESNYDMAEKSDFDGEIESGVGNEELEYIICDSLAEAEKTAGFAMSVPDKFAGFSILNILCIKNTKIEIRYTNLKQNEILIRKWKKLDYRQNISGKSKEKKNVVELGNIQVTMYGDMGKYRAVFWEMEEYKFEIIVEGTTLTQKQIEDLVLKTK